MATPPKPIARPTMRVAFGRSFSHAQATSAPNSGTVAFKIDDRPMEIDKSAKVKQAKGIAEFKRPIDKASFQCVRKSGSRPRIASSGISISAAMPTRRPAVGSAPNSKVAMRMNINDAPQIAANNTNSTCQGGEKFFKGKFIKPFLIAARRSCAPNHRRNRLAHRCCRPRGGRAR